jgi:hypothetical protein
MYAIILYIIHTHNEHTHTWIDRGERGRGRAERKSKRERTRERERERVSVWHPLLTLFRRLLLESGTPLGSDSAAESMCEGRVQ